MLCLLLLAALQDSTVQLQVGDTVRTYDLHVPARAPDRRLTGIVLAFHAAGGTATGFRNGTGSTQ